MPKLTVRIVLFCAVIFFSSCGKKQDDEPTKHTDQSRLTKISNQQNTKQNSPKITSISDNPAFYDSQNLSPKAAEVKDLDAAIRPVLKQIFGDAKIIYESTKPETEQDGEIVENRFTYVVRQILVPQDGKTLHSALCNAGFGLSPRLGKKPTIFSNGAVMSLFKNTSLRSYSLEIKIDTNKQQITVKSYKLGSKYDRLM